jgi:hypothetical protein
MFPAIFVSPPVLARGRLYTVKIPVARRIKARNNNSVGTVLAWARSAPAIPQNCQLRS